MEAMNKPEKKCVNMKKMYLVSMCLFIGLWSSPILAGEVDVLDVKISSTGADMYRFSVTLKHADEGWDHYADKWDILDETGTLLGTRVLMHPHVGEQPFTRSLVLSIPMNVTNIRVRGHDKVHGYGGKEMEVPLK
jgi:hypothetical protein